MTIVAIDHDMTLLRSMCGRFVALDQGSLLADGTPEEVLCHPEVVRAFLGDGDTAERSAVVG